MILLDGKATSKKRLEKLKGKISAHSKKPGLSVIRVGEDPASKIYVSKKIAACLDLGIQSEEIDLPERVIENTLLDKIHALNDREDVHGILVQLPLPKQIDTNHVLEAISPKKDVDGIHPENIGRLALGQKGFVACTPLGIMNLLAEYNIPLEGKRAVVVGRSRIVGRPMSLLLDQANCTVTVVHSRTQNSEELMRQADLLVVAAGKPHFVGAMEVKEDAIVIDVGIHRQANSKKLIGDVIFDEVKDKVTAITPVPGGVGPMTICSLLENTYDSFLAHE